MTAGFWLIVAIFALGLSYPICMAWSLLDRALDARRRATRGRHPSGRRVQP